MLAVGTVVVNRLQSPRYPKTVCGVVGQRNQFADGTLTKPAGGRSLALAFRVADQVIAGERHAGVGGAMFFHTAGYTFPYRNMAYVVAAGGNVFYEKRTPGTFEPIHPATLVARTDRARPPRAPEIRVASADDEAPRRERARVAATPEPKPAERPARRVQVASATEDELPLSDAPIPRRGKVHRPEPLQITSHSFREARGDGPPTIADLIELDLQPKRAR